MATYSDRLQSGLTRAVPDFSLLNVGAHDTDTRASASILMAMLVISLATILSLVLKEPAPPFASARTGEHVAPPPASDKVTIIAAKPRLDVPCSEQTWPYIDRRCLTESTQKPATAQSAARSVEPAVPAPPNDARKAATAPAETRANTQPDPYAADPNAAYPNARYEPRQWSADSDGVMQDEYDDAAPMMPPPPPPQYYRERRRHADPGREIERQFRHFTRQFFRF